MKMDNDKNKKALAFIDHLAVSRKGLPQEGEMLLLPKDIDKLRSKFSGTHPEIVEMPGGPLKLPLLEWGKHTDL